MITSLIAPSPAIPITSVKPKNRGRRGWAVATVGAMVLAALTFGMGGTASAAPGDFTPPEDGQVVVTADVTSTITLVMATTTLAITGIPGALAPGVAPVTYHVITNNFAGYTVSVFANDPVLTGAIPASPTIPIAALQYQPTALGTFVPVGITPGTTVETKTTASVASPGDPFSNVYQLQIPAGQNSDTYTVDLTYTATAS